VRFFAIAARGEKYFFWKKKSDKIFLLVLKKTIKKGQKNGKKRAKKEHKMLVYIYSN
jgi:hypothetical protein